MCYYNRDVDCPDDLGMNGTSSFQVRWRPAAIFADDQIWTVQKGEKKCSPGDSGKVETTRITGDPNTGVMANVPNVSVTKYDVNIFPKCYSNAHIEEHGWASLYTYSEYDSEAGCGCGVINSLGEEGF